MCALAVAALAGDGHIATLIDALRACWAWDDKTSFVADQGHTIVGQPLSTNILLDAPREIVDVLGLELEPAGAPMIGCRPIVIHSSICV